MQDYIPDMNDACDAITFCKLCCFFFFFFFCIEDKEEEDLPRKRPTKRTAAKRRRPAAKRQKSTSVPSDDSNNIKTVQKLSQDGQPLSRGPNLSASSSSSGEDEFDSLVKDLNEDEMLNTIMKEHTLTTGQKRKTKWK